MLLADPVLGAARAARVESERKKLEDEENLGVARLRTVAKRKKMEREFSEQGYGGFMRWLQRRALDLGELFGTEETWGTSMPSGPNFSGIPMSPLEANTKAVQDNTDAVNRQNRPVRGGGE